jgi:mRNA interferase RelE/StbE
MQEEFTKDFLKSIKKLDKTLLSRINKVVDNLEEAISVTELPNVKKLEGYKDLYRVRIGDYRLVFRLKPKLVIVLIFLHRKDIYKNLDNL